MLIKILLFITLLFKFTTIHAASQNKLVDFTTVESFFKAFNNVRIDFRQCSENKEEINNCHQGTMYITHSFQNKSRTRMRIDYKDPRSSIIIDKDTIMYCDHDLEETSYFSEDLLFFNILTANDETLKKYFISDQSDDKNFVFRQLLKNGGEIFVTLSFIEQKKIHQIIIKLDDNTIYRLDTFDITQYYEQNKFSMLNPYSSKKKYK